MSDKEVVLHPDCGEVRGCIKPECLTKLHIGIKLFHKSLPLLRNRLSQPVA
jgi:hypothetical protein